ncbi:hypothetical protein [Halalkalibacterium ligniniphilum]|uniref:hypothetical protein n=1 Tax=Halalkalibacterium ligniniphilum TaxID=1134413 RepID=UPI0003475231|nr:hypothetical protein [Halalkalibacterium ligniniphilum]
MQLYFSPELLKENAQVLNIVSDDHKPVGYLSILMEEEKKKIYVYGQLENEGAQEDFKDLVKPYLQGLTKLKPELDVYSYLSVGGAKLNIGEAEGEKED